MSVGDRQRARAEGGSICVSLSTFLAFLLGRFSAPDLRLLLLVAGGRFSASLLLEGVGSGRLMGALPGLLGVAARPASSHVQQAGRPSQHASQRGGAMPVSVRPHPCLPPTCHGGRVAVDADGHGLPRGTLHTRTCGRTHKHEEASGLSVLLLLLHFPCLGDMSPCRAPTVPAAGPGCCCCCGVGGGLLPECPELLLCGAHEVEGAGPGLRLGRLIQHGLPRRGERRSGRGLGGGGEDGRGRAERREGGGGWLLLLLLLGGEGLLQLPCQSISKAVSEPVRNNGHGSCKGPCCPLSVTAPTWRLWSCRSRISLRAASIDASISSSLAAARVL